MSKLLVLFPLELLDVFRQVRRDVSSVIEAMILAIVAYRGDELDVTDVHLTVINVAVVVVLHLFCHMAEFADKCGLAAIIQPLRKVSAGFADERRHVADGVPARIFVLQVVIRSALLRQLR